MQHDNVLKTLNFDLTSRVDGGGAVDKKLLPCCSSEKMNFDLLTPRVGRSVGKIFATILLHS